MTIKHLISHRQFNIIELTEDKVQFSKKNVIVKINVHPEIKRPSESRYTLSINLGKELGSHPVLVGYIDIDKFTKKHGFYSPVWDIIGSPISINRDRIIRVGKTITNKYFESDFNLFKDNHETIRTYRLENEKWKKVA